MIQTQLIDNRNFDQLADQLVDTVRATTFVGLDTETQDDNRHDGLNQFCGYNPETRKKAANTKLVFDMRRTVMTGFSLYPENHDRAYYLNLNHLDVDNRVPWEKARRLLDALNENAYFVAHNAPFELTVFASCYRFALPKIIDTLQMCVSAYGPDEYDRGAFISAGRGGIGALVQRLQEASRGFDPEKPDSMPPELADLVYKIIAKESTAAHSYNGFVKDITYGYGLKKVVKSWFGHEMTNYEQCLRGRAHMGQLTGEETADYGAEDAYWAIRVFRKIMEFMAVNCPDTIDCFFTQENPMAHVYSDIWQKGMKVNTAAVLDRRERERVALAHVLRNMKKTVLALLPTAPQAPHEGLLTDSWYAKGHVKYRKQLVDWAKSPDTDDDFAQCQQVRGPVSNAWADDKGQKQSVGPNLSHYMPVRTLIYDLTGTKIIRSDGKIQSDGEARGRLKERFDKEGNKIASDLIGQLAAISGIEQRMKLYLTPYSQLMDPETGRMYPNVSSMLASRRMAASYPNPMQLGKRGESVYVRGFFEADYPDHVLVSIDWSGIELVEIGEFSGDPEFIKAFGQIPHEDLHTGAAADILSADVPGLTEEIFKSLKSIKEVDEFMDRYGSELENTTRLFTNLKGEPLAIDKVAKYWRTEVGKGANFNYWYSGWLATIGERMGWSQDKTALATERYRQRFHVAESWRLNTIAEAQQHGFVHLPDGHRRVRFESTPLWMNYFLDKFQVHGMDLEKYNAVISYIARKIAKRSHNQTVNSVIQGTCATIAKRSILRINEKMRDRGWTDREARFLIPIHDELLFSVHRSLVAEFIALGRGTMIDHPDIFKLCKLDASPSVGLTFEPWHELNSPLGQVELFEAPPIPGVPQDKVGKRLNDNETQGVVDYLFFNQQRALAA